MSVIRRRKKLIKPDLQVTLIGSFVGLTATALLLQFLFLGGRLTSAVAQLDGPGGELASELPKLLIEVLAISLVVLLPVIFGLGILLTFRLVGPIYRFEQHLTAVARGETTGPCKIRKGDKLQSLCDAINSAVEPLISRSPEADESDPGASDASGPEVLRHAG